MPVRIMEGPIENPALNHQRDDGITLTCSVEDYIRWQYIMSDSGCIATCNREVLGKYGVHLLQGPDSKLYISASDRENIDGVKTALQEILRFYNKILIVRRLTEKESILKDIGNIRTVEIMDESGLYFLVFKSSDESAPLCNEIIDQSCAEHCVVLKGVFYKYRDSFQTLAKRLNVNCKVELRQGTEEMNCVCIIAGNIFHFKKQLQAFVDALKSEAVNVHVTHKHCLEELQIETDLDEMLTQQNSDCVAICKGQKITVYGFDAAELWKACLLIEKQILEKAIVVTGNARRKDSGVDSILKEICGLKDGKVASYFDRSAMSIYLVGLAKSIEETSHFVEKALVDLATPQQSSVKATGMDEENPMRKLQVENEDVMVFLSSKIGEKFIRQVKETFGVKIKICGEGENKVRRKKNGDATVYWEFPNSKRLVLRLSSPEAIQAKVIVKFNNGSGKKRKFLVLTLPLLLILYIPLYLR